MTAIGRFPILPTAIVAISVTVMVALGIWQLNRAEEKEALLARYEQARNSQAMVSWPDSEESLSVSLYRRSKLRCESLADIEPRAGRSATGEPGWVHVADCRLASGQQASVVLGWSRDPAQRVSFEGGALSGVIAPGPRLVVDPAVGGLEPMSAPDPADLPNNHLSYAGQWFLFALTALVIYLLALRRRGMPKGT